MAQVDMSNHSTWLEEQIKHQYETKKQTDCRMALGKSVLRRVDRELPLSRYLELDEHLWDADITSIHKLYKEKIALPVEVVLYYIKRIYVYENVLSSVTQVFEEAIDQAIELESKEFDPELPLFGIPILLKDNIATEGHPNTAGSDMLRDVTTLRASTVAEKLKEAGAIIVGKTNLSEWANFMTFNSSNGYSALGGQTVNPYGRFDVGGSSAGSAVAVAAGLIPVSIGSETAGSLVYPASQNAVVTIKPTVGLVSRDLIVPISETQDTAGPMATCVKDAALVLSSIAGGCQHDRATEHAVVKDYVGALDRDIKGLRIGILSNQSVKEEYRDNDEQVILAACKVFEDLGAEVVEVELEEKVFATNMLDVLLYEFHRDVNAYLANPEVDTGLTLEAIRDSNLKDLENRAAFGQSIIDKSIDERMSPKAYEELVDENVKIAEDAIDKVKEKVDAVLSISNYSTIAYATCGYPAITVPAGYRDSGEPVGITIFAGRYEEDLLISLGAGYEKATGHRRAPALQ
ncbi:MULTISPECIES: amidase family protein [unclassified Fusibacter]|uniref:amidase family protein n=1 Tax=unclassified Fusibacter TaxID=2624464 RepID=UPI001011A1FA|nr:MULTISPECIES: amidase family protein [unclassified Fusibacter]MCK8061213.1 amidase family protein [Fusibacter sp. A2]NPE23443.1 amidase [Fusibacter sp. A1]RXV59222.1 amidase [Fusibacter sp. A1]